MVSLFLFCCDEDTFFPSSVQIGKFYATIVFFYEKETAAPKEAAVRHGLPAAI